jgi:hypothetical protein
VRPVWPWALSPLAAAGIALATAACDAIVGVASFSPTMGVPDAGADATGARDSGHDAHHVHPRDAGHDAGHDVRTPTPDTGSVDTGLFDAPRESALPDTGFDAGKDSGFDAGCEAGTQESFGPCGNCGTEQMTCTPDHTWGDPECLGQGVCAPDASMTTACTMCGTITTPCTPGCTWGTPGACVGQGVCEPGDIMCDHFNGDGTLAFSCIGATACGTAYSNCDTCLSNGAFWDWYYCDTTCAWNGSCNVDPQCSASSSCND